MPVTSRGCVFRRPNSPHWFIKFFVNGERKRESTGTSDREQALEFLRRRTLEAERGLHVDVDQRPTFQDMRARLVENYAFKRNRTTASVQLNRLAEFFGGMLGEAISDEKVVEYSRKRLHADRVAPSTLRRELAILKRMLRLSAARLPRVPLIDMPRVDNARQGFFEEKDLQCILPHLAPHARHLVEFLYLTGWRSSEAFSLLWSDVDWTEQTVRLRTSKNREPRIFPFKYHPPLAQLLRRQRGDVSRWELEHAAVCPSVFHWRGRPIRKLRRSWTTACRRAGCRGGCCTIFAAPRCAI